MLFANLVYSFAIPHYPLYCALVHIPTLYMSVGMIMMDTNHDEMLAIQF